LFVDDENNPLLIEWIINDGEFVEHIGLQREGVCIVGYDGVFEVPIQIIEWIESIGYNCDEIK